jgi:hypothetical protein
MHQLASDIERYGPLLKAGHPLEPAPASAIPTARRRRDHLAGGLPESRQDSGDVPAH